MQITYFLSFYKKSAALKFAFTRGVGKVSAFLKDFVREEPQAGGGAAEGETASPPNKELDAGLDSLTLGL